MSRTTSFPEFLKSAELGPLVPGMTLRDVAKELGPPDWFQFHPDTKLVPDYWGYGKVEVQFDQDPPYRMAWFQIEHAGSLQGEVEMITTDLQLSLEGFSGSTSPSDFLKAGLWSLPKVIVHVGACHDDIYLNLSAGKAAIFFRVDTSFIADGNAEGYLEKMPVRQLMRAVNPRTGLDSIYALKDAREAFLAASAVTCRCIEGKHYLAAMEH